MNYSNFHTHSTHCDGKHSVDEIAREALRLGCPELGYSGHSLNQFRKKSFSMSKESTLTYQEAVQQAKEAYGHKIRLYCGIEQEYYSNASTAEYEYVIGSVHYVKQGEEYIPVDKDAQSIKDGSDKYFDGDVMAFVKEYYRLVADVPKAMKCHILGHFDLVTKFREKTPLFDADGKEYQTIALEALEALSKHKLVYELNSGAISRGYRTDCYPAPFLLDAMAQLHLPVVLSSDSHSKDTLLFGFEKMSELAKTHKLTLFSSMEEILDYTH